MKKCLLFLFICLWHLHGAWAGPVTPATVNTHDLQKLLIFLQQKDMSGESNAEKLLTDHYKYDWDTNYEAWINYDVYGISWVPGTDGKYRIKEINWSSVLEKLSGLFDFSGCDSLTHVRCNYQALSSINLKNCGNLETVEAWNNQLTSVDFRGCLKLAMANLNQNQLLFSSIQYPEGKERALSGYQTVTYHTMETSGEVVVDLSSEYPYIQDEGYKWFINQSTHQEQVEPIGAVNGLFILKADFLGNDLYSEMRKQGCEIVVRCDVTNLQKASIMVSVDGIDLTNDAINVETTLYKEDGTPTDIQPDKDGAFYFRGIVPGNYILSAKATGYLFSYYTENGQQAPTWIEATKVHITPLTETYRATIMLVPEPELKEGDITIKGTILDKSEMLPFGLKAKVSRDATVGAYSSPAAAKSLKSDDFILLRTTTVDDNGNYEFSNLPAGIYRIKVEISGYSTETIEINAVTGNQYTGNNFVVDDDIKNIIANRVMSAPQIQGTTKLVIYPNPVTDILRITGLEKGNNVIKIINVLGQIVWSTNSSSPEISLNIGHQPAGMYFIHIESNGKESTYKVLKK